MRLCVYETLCMRLVACDASAALASLCVSISPFWVRSLASSSSRRATLLLNPWTVSSDPSRSRSQSSACARSSVEIARLFFESSSLSSSAAARRALIASIARVPSTPTLAAAVHARWGSDPPPLADESEIDISSSRRDISRCRSASRDSRRATSPSSICERRPCADAALAAAASWHASRSCASSLDCVAEACDVLSLSESRSSVTFCSSSLVWWSVERALCSRASDCTRFDSISRTLSPCTISSVRSTETSPMARCSPSRLCGGVGGVGGGWGGVGGDQTTTCVTTCLTTPLSP